MRSPRCGPRTRAALPASCNIGPKDEAHGKENAASNACKAKPRNLDAEERDHVLQLAITPSAHSSRSAEGGQPFEE